MDHDLLAFVRQYIGIVAAAFVPVVLLAFLSMPYTLGRHPGEAQVTAPTARHMT